MDRTAGADANGESTKDLTRPSGRFCDQDFASSGSATRPAAWAEATVCSHDSCPAARTAHAAAMVISDAPQCTHPGPLCGSASSTKAAPTARATMTASARDRRRVREAFADGGVGEGTAAVMLSRCRVPLGNSQGTAEDCL